MTFHDELNEIRKRAGVPAQERVQPYDGSSPQLYHGTGVWALGLIMQDNRLDEGIYWGKPQEPHGPRLTESYQAALEFIEYSSPEWPIGGVLVLDTQALMNSYELVRYTDTPYNSDIPWGDEQEVVPLTKSITPLTRYLRSIKIDPHAIDEGASDEGMEWMEEVIDPKILRPAVLALKQSPWFNR